MNTFISCDWGTSAFRLRLIDANTKEVLATIKTDWGIAAVYNDWNNNHPATDRLQFYSNILADGVRALAQECKHALEDITIVISGMASSSIGMMDLPYKALPFHLDGADVLTEVVSSLPNFHHQLLFISGAKTREDVMRGEETKLLGCDVSNQQEKQLLILPGTHTKHVVVEDKVAVDFKTYMTGELFSLLSTKSVLAASVEKGEKGQENDNKAFFLKGVTEAANNNFLNSIFHVRTYHLFNYHSPHQSYQYLSGLLIGNELKELLNKKYSSITLVATGVLAPLYRQALQALGIQINKETDADEALIAGQCKMYLQMKKQQF
ncbi:2-dehydro-3-deoxygalactonokinase [Ilyomonas limi]|uniref:2-dehydro-3-deoxygalactonokinase n=1 Tax=Ilyomonas limi TaxID=2575867 RepID=A0A4U3L8J2_9BACT|nr:2-dehydro-3-deoxygalactonokinase [Ilyomonas limi]TKK71588.1 2-dehydro-3-deoxygalactonokinase [Ilyomonas limi]